MKIRILIVDDEKEICEGLERHFKFLGYDASCETNPLNAIKRVEEENFQVVISDIRMPEMNGPELVEKIKLHNGAIKVIMITGYVTMSSIMNCMRYGAETCLFKPLDDLSLLEKAVDEAVEKIEMWQDIMKYIRSMKDQPVS